MTGMTTRDLPLLAFADDIHLAPDGRRVAYTVTTVESDANRYRTRIWLAASDGLTAPHPLTSGTRSDTLPRWSPDGRLLAFARDLGPDSQSGVWVIPTDGPGEATLMCAQPDGVSALAWSPDGTRVALVAREPDPIRYGSIGNRPETAGLPPRRITRLFSRHNGEGWIYDRPQHLFVIPIDGSAGPLSLTAGPWSVASPAWSPDGTRLAFVSARHDDRDLDLCNDIWLVDATGGTPVALTDTSGEWSSVSWSPGGDRLAFNVHPSPLDSPRHIRTGVLDLSTGTRRDLSAVLDRNASPYPNSTPPVWCGADVFFPVEDHGAVHLYRVDGAGGTPSQVIAGEREVRSFDAIRPSGVSAVVAAVLTSPTELPEVYISLGGDDLHRRSDLTRSLRERVALVVPERFTATSSDGAEVECWAMAPLGIPPSGRVPTILNIHGGPFTSYGWSFFDEFQLQVGAGFGVIYCNPRGSAGYSEGWGRAIRWPEASNDPGFGWGGLDYDDVMACVDEACRRFDWIDDARLGVQGGSYGGYLTSWIVAHSDRFAAACSERAVNDLLLHECTSDAASSLRGCVGYTHVERPDLYMRHSPASYVADMHTPMLMVHSEDDLRCPVSQAEEIFVGLRLLGRNPELVRFPGENHDLSRSGSPTHRAQRADIILAWFADKLRSPARGDRPSPSQLGESGYVRSEPFA
jgi:dipeptidyl aminopeptidase/acylaminoacyl peptidase